MTVSDGCHADFMGSPPHSSFTCVRRTGAWPRTSDTIGTMRSSARRSEGWPSLVLKNGKRWLPQAQAAAAVDELLPRPEYERSLYHGLVSEGVLVEDMRRHEEDEREGIVFISYERYADHVIADLLLTTHLDAESPGSAFADGGGLAFLCDETTYTSRGLIEALCIQVPERTGMELAELAPSLADRPGFADSFRRSLVWRRLDAFSETTLVVLNKRLATRHDKDDTLETLLTVASVADHPYNAKFLDRQLRRRSMPDRDAWWSVYVHRAWGVNGAVDRLVHWASDVTPGTELSNRADELCSIVLSWMFTTSNRFLRDRATKALVSLLTGRLMTVRILLERFADVDDPYVAERVYAVAYGVVMRSGTRQEVGAIASKAYELVFADGAPPPHVLLRDYARGIIERDDIPDMASLIATRNFYTEICWLNLRGYFNWRQPHPADVEASDVDRRDLWLLLTGYFVRAADAEAFMTWAEGVDFMGRWMPDPPEIHKVFFGEYAWAPAFRYLSRHPDFDLNGWVQPGHGCPVTVCPATLSCSCKPSDFDCSVEEHYDLQVSQRDLLKQLELKWTGRGGDFVDREANLAVFDPTAHEDGPTALLARDDLVRRYLDQSDMAPCWTVLGEKRVIGREASRNYQGALHISGAYTLGDDGPEGFLKFRRDRLDQENETGTPHATGSASTSQEAGSSPDTPAREATARRFAGAEGTET